MAVMFRAIFHFIWSLVYESLLRSDDSLEQRMRKLCVASGMLFTPLLAYDSIWHITRAMCPLGSSEYNKDGDGGDDNAHTIIYASSLIVMCDLLVLACFVTTWISTRERRNRTVGNNTMAVWHSASALFLMTRVLLSTRAFYAFLILGITTVEVCEGQRTVFRFMYALLMLFNSYNTLAIENDSWVRLVVIPEHGTIHGGFLHLTATFLCSLGVVIVFNLVLLEYAVNAQKKVAAGQVAADVASLLQRYHTSAAHNVLELYSNNTEFFDSTLHDSLKQITVNMEAYRPFLPNYLVVATDQEQTENQKRLESLLKPSQLTEGNALTLSLPTLVPADLSELSETVSDSKALQLNYNANNSGSTNNNSVNNIVTLPDDVEGAGGREDDINAVLMTPFLCTTEGSAPDRPSQHGVTPKRHIAIAWLNLSRHVSLSLSSSSSASSSLDGIGWDVLSKITDNTVLVADRTGGTVHCVCADRILLSWNTARRVANPTASAALFLLQTKQSSTKATEMESCMCSGEARFAIVGVQRHYPVIWCDWFDRLHTLFERCSRSSSRTGCGSICNRSPVCDGASLSRLSATRMLAAAVRIDLDRSVDDSHPNAVWVLVAGALPCWTHNSTEDPTPPTASNPHDDALLNALHGDRVVAIEGSIEVDGALPLSAALEDVAGDEELTVMGLCREDENSVVINNNLNNNTIECDDSTVDNMVEQRHSMTRRTWCAHVQRPANMFRTIREGLLLQLAQEGGRDGREGTADDVVVDVSKLLSGLTDPLNLFGHVKSLVLDEFRKKKVY
eukprot:PhM_4_TR10318/c0_g1_i1/m.71358